MFEQKTGIDVNVESFLRNRVVGTLHAVAVDGGRVARRQSCRLRSAKPKSQQLESTSFRDAVGIGNAVEGAR